MRAEMIGRVRAGERWDLVVIGGGATGLGAALDAAARGYRTLLLEAHDVAKGTSSRSTKLLHGGVRYLARGELGLVREALRERTRLLRNAPHLAGDRLFLVPAYARGAVPYYGLGLALYDLLAGRASLGRSRPVSRPEALRLAPTLRPDGLRGGVAYHDGQFDDARLAVALLRTFVDRGGTALTYCPAIAVLRRGGRVSGVAARDAETGEEFRVEARAVLNAAGVFVDAVRSLDDPDARPMIRPSRGAHLVLDRAFLPGEAAVLVPNTDDGRVLFAIPWRGRVLLGTTDTPVDDPDPEPHPSTSEVEYLLKYAARYLSEPPGRGDIRSQFAGLRPLVDASRGSGATASLSREHAVVISDSGLVTIAGGKWTTYRAMAAEAVDRVAAVGDLPRRPSGTADLRLRGWTDDVRDGPLARYGSDAPAVRAVLAERPGYGEPLHPGLPDLAGEVAWAARFEFARTVEDVLARRTGTLMLDARASLEAAPRVASILAAELGRDPGWRDAQVRAFRALANYYIV